MSTLPAEVKEAILTALVDSYDDEDPAFQWTQLRNLSLFQRRRIEKHFEIFWLPKLTITIYLGVWFSFDYAYVSLDESRSTEGVATYKVVPGQDSAYGGELRVNLERSRREKLNAQNPEVILRFGEGFGTHGGLRGGYIINDSELPGLEVSADGLVLKFDWRGALNALFREERLLRKYREEMMNAAMQNSRQLPGTQIDSQTQNRYLIKCLSLDIQMASRVAVRRHRHARADSSGQSAPLFSQESYVLHRQVPTNSTPAMGFDRITGPDLFEIVQQEESMVLYLPGWQNLNNEALLELYAEEFGWACCKLHNRSNDLEYQQNRANVWRTRDSDMDFHVLRRRCRYDPLG